MCLWYHNDPISVQDFGLVLVYTSLCNNVYSTGATVYVTNVILVVPLSPESKSFFWGFNWTWTRAWQFYLVVLTGFGEFGLRLGNVVAKWFCNSQIQIQIIKHKLDKNIYDWNLSVLYQSNNSDLSSSFFNILLPWMFLKNYN